MTYRNYVTLKGLDEARKHQELYRKGLLKDEEWVDVPPTKGPAHSFTEELRREIAMTTGSHQEVADKFKVCVETVRNYRKEFGVFTDSRRKLKGRTQEERRAIGSDPRRVSVVAEAYGVKEHQVTRYRAAFRNGEPDL